MSSDDQRELLDFLRGRIAQRINVRERLRRQMSEATPAELSAALQLSHDLDAEDSADLSAVLRCKNAVVVGEQRGRDIETMLHLLRDEAL